MSSFEGLGVGEGADFKGTAGGGLPNYFQHIFQPSFTQHKLIFNSSLILLTRIILFKPKASVPSIFLELFLFKN